MNVIVQPTILNLSFYKQVQKLVQVEIYKCVYKNEKILNYESKSDNV